MTKTTIPTYEHPDREACFAYLNAYDSPPHVIGHCEAVADVAVRIGRALNEVGGTEAPPIYDVTFESFPRDGGRIGYRIDHQRTMINTGKARPFDLELTLAAGLLHDMARVEEEHWNVAADFCLREGLIEEAKIIRVHMMYEFTTDAYHLTEADLVCIGDRVVLEDYYAGIDKRMEYIIAKAERQGNMAARPIILRKKEDTKVLLHQIEERIGKSLDELMSE